MPSLASVRGALEWGSKVPSSAMQLLRVNVGQTRLVQYQGRPLSTAIFKEPISGPVEVGELGLAGDDQADKSVHGGVDKAVYAYSQENYDWWQTQLQGRELVPGEFGENLTVEGMTDDLVYVGDQYQIGTALLEVTQPRQPCMKLGVKMKSPVFVKLFHQAVRPGFYLRVLRPGVLSAGDSITRIHRADHSLSIAELYRLRFDRSTSKDELQRIAETPALSAAWRDDIHQLLQQL